MSVYLTEKKLGEILKNLLPDRNFIHDKSVPGSKNKRRRPDYRNDDLQLIIEFDGDSHYCKAGRIINDAIKDADYNTLGYKVIRIPYFIQMNTNLLQFIFGEGTKLTYAQEYDHGFIDKRAVLPADYCELGIEMFENDLQKFSQCKDEIIRSINLKISELGNINLVLPKSLQYLVGI